MHEGCMHTPASLCGNQPRRAVDCTLPHLADACVLCWFMPQDNAWEAVAITSPDNEMTLADVKVQGRCMLWQLCSDKDAHSFLLLVDANVELRRVSAYLACVPCLVPFVRD